MLYTEPPDMFCAKSNWMNDANGGSERMDGEREIERMERERV